MFYVGDYDTKLFVLSILIALLGSYASLDMFYTVKDGIKKESMNALMISSITMGLGLWTMHFIGMLGYITHVIVKFDFFLTSLSLVVSIIASFISLYIFAQSKGKFINLLYASLVMGISMAAIHFIGMSAMHMEVEMDYNINWNILAVIIGVTSSFVSFIIFRFFKKGLLLSALIMGMGISSMHYTAMRALSLHGNYQIFKQQMMSFDEISYQFSKNQLAFGLGIITIIFIIVIIFLAYISKFSEEKRHKVTKLHYESLVEHNPNLVFSLNNDGLITSVNPKGLSILKFQKEELLSTSFLKLLSSENIDEIQRALKDCYSGHPSDIEAVIKNADNSFIPMFLTFIPIIVDKKPAGMFIIGKDITDLIAYKERIKKAQRDLIETVRNHQGMIFKFIKFGDQFIHTLIDGELSYKCGFEPSKVVGKTLFDFLPDESANDKHVYYEKTWAGENVSYEGNVNGIVYFAQLRPVIEDGKVKEVIGSAVDITDKKIAELELLKEKDFYRNIFNTMSEGIFIYKANGEKIVLNENVYSFTGMNKEEFAKQALDDITLQFIGEDGSSITKEINPVYYTQTTGKPLLNKIMGIRGENNQTIWLSVNTLLLNNLENQNESKVLLTMSDITERKRLEQDIIRAKEEAVEASLAKSEFLSKMSHELRTPLNGVLGFSQLLEMDQSLTPQQQSFVQKILIGGRHLLDLINEVLDLTRIESGKLKVSLDYVDIINLIRECVNLLKPMANQKNIQIIYKDLSEAQNFYVFCDPLRLRQIVINLIDNAIKYNVENGKVIIVCEKHEDEVLVRIRDTGIGITKNEQQKIFDPFYRVNSINVKGTGIGLSIVKQLIQLMNGQIGLISGYKGGGSEFWFRLPLSHQTSNQFKSNKKIQSDLLECVNVHNILYIEDNLANIQLVQQILGNMSNIYLKTVMTGEEGIELIQKEEFDLILLDINLPGMSGFDVLKILKSSSKTINIPVIALSAFAMPDDIQRANKDGFNDYITKPIDIPLFLKTISKFF